MKSRDFLLKKYNLLKASLQKQYLQCHLPAKFENNDSYLNKKDDFFKLLQVSLNCCEQWLFIRWIMLKTILFLYMN